MELIGLIFHEIFYRPLLNLLMIFYTTLPGRDFGAAIIALTFLLKIGLHPLTRQTIKTQRDFQELQPKIKEIQEKYKHNRERQAQELLALYREKRINPFSGIFPLIIQLPILIALFQVLVRVFDSSALQELYPFISSPGTINPFFLSLIDLSKPNIFLAAVTGIVTFLQMKLSFLPHRSPPPNQSQRDVTQLFQKQMMFLMPVFIFFAALQFPAGLAFYWIFTTIGTIAEQFILLRS